MLSCLMLFGCETNDSEAIRALTDSGYHDITITDSSLFFVSMSGCGADDGAVYSAHAINVANKPVNVIVCCGGPLSFKGCVVRSK